MNIIKSNNGQYDQTQAALYLYVADETCDEDKQALGDKFHLPFFAGQQGIIAVLPKDFANYPSGVLLVGADDTCETLGQVADVASLNDVLVYVSDFKDGRVFSLIRQIRQVNQHASILVAGNFGLDQASYFVKSGATGFVVNDDKVETLKHTLNDLKSAYDGQSVRALPMFS